MIIIFFFLKNHLITEQVFKKSKSRGSYQGGLDPEKPAKALSDHENLGAIGDRTVKKNLKHVTVFGGRGVQKTPNVQLYGTFIMISNFFFFF